MNWNWKRTTQITIATALIIIAIKLSKITLRGQKIETIMLIGSGIITIIMVETIALAIKQEEKESETT